MALGWVLLLSLLSIDSVEAGLAPLGVSPALTAVVRAAAASAAARRSPPAQQLPPPAARCAGLRASHQTAAPEHPLNPPPPPPPPAAVWLLHPAAPRHHAGHRRGGPAGGRVHKRPRLHPHVSGSGSGSGGWAPAAPLLPDRLQCSTAAASCFRMPAFVGQTPAVRPRRGCRYAAYAANGGSYQGAGAAKGKPAGQQRHIGAAVPAGGAP